MSKRSILFLVIVPGLGTSKRICVFARKKCVMSVTVLGRAKLCVFGWPADDVKVIEQQMETGESRVESRTNLYLLSLLPTTESALF